MLDCHRDSQVVHKASTRLSLLELAQPVSYNCGRLCCCLSCAHVYQHTRGAALDKGRGLANFDTSVPRTTDIYQMDELSMNSAYKARA